MKWRSPRFLITLSILGTLLLLGCVVFVISYAANTQNKSTTTSPTRVVFPALPTPEPTRTTYTSILFGYTIEYPTEWTLREFQNGSDVRVYKIYSQAMPEAFAFDIYCAANPTQMDNENWWKQTQSADLSQKGIGQLTLNSGVVAFVSIGHGQGGYTIYTLVHKQVACEIVAYETDPANAKFVSSSVNTFQWQ